MNKSRRKNNGKQTVKIKKQNYMRKKNKIRDRKHKNKSRRRNRKTIKMKGGSQPFFGIGYLYDKMVYNMQEFAKPLLNSVPPVPNNPTSVNPDISHQFDRISTKPYDTIGPDIKSITEQAFAR